MDVHRYACLLDLVCCSLCCRLSTQNGNNLLEMFLFAPLVRCQSLRNKFARTLFQCIFHWNPTRAKSTSRNHILCHSMLTRMMLFASFFPVFLLSTFRRKTLFRCTHSDALLLCALISTFQFCINGCILRSSIYLMKQIY